MMRAWRPQHGAAARAPGRWRAAWQAPRDCGARQHPSTLGRQHRFAPATGALLRAGSGDNSGGGGGGGAGGGGGGSGGGSSGDESSFEGRDGIPVFMLCLASGAAVAALSAMGQPAGEHEASPTSTNNSSGSSTSSSSEGCTGSKEGPPPSVSVIVPALNEAKGIRETLRYLKALTPAPLEIIVADGGSSDGTVREARREGVRVVRGARRGRAVQMNSGAAAAKGDLLVFVHADTRPPQTLIPVVRAALRNPRNVIGGFNTVVELPGRVLLYMTAFHFSKTYLAPLLFRPLSFVRGLRCLFGDQSLFVRAADFRRVGGYDERLPLMEDLDLILRMHMAGPGGGLKGRGHVAHVLRPVNRTSGRRLGALGNVYGTYVCARIAWEWYFGAPPERVKELYTQLWTDRFR